MANHFKFSIGDSVVVNDKAPGDYEGRIGVVASKTNGRSEYEVRFGDGQNPSYGWLDSHCLAKVAQP